MSDFLRTMEEGSRERLREARARVGESELLRRARLRPDPTPLALDATGFDVFAEIKVRSPLSGSSVATGSMSGPARAAAYARGGACAVSVLTEPSAFGGSLEDLSPAADASSLPAMRKDFLVDPYQVIEARLYGASGVLLIARLMSDGLLREMLDAAHAMKLFAVVEGFSMREVDRAINAVAVAGKDQTALVGVNARDLATLKIDPTRHKIAALAPNGADLIAESGIETPDDAARAARLGYRAVLVGSALMRAHDPALLLAAMVAAGRVAVIADRVPR